MSAFPAKSWTEFLLRHPFRTLGLAAGFLLLLKLLLVPLFRSLPHIGDEIFYWEQSTRYFETWWTSEDMWGPGQFAFLGLIHLFFPEGGIAAASVIQLGIHTLTAGFIFSVARQLENERMGLAAALLYLLLPETVSYSYLLFSETWGTFWFFAALWFYLRALVLPGTLFYLGMSAAGVCFGLHVLFRAINLYFLPLWFVHLWLFLPASRLRRGAALVVFLAGAAAAVSPQAFKHYRLFGEFLPVSTGGWVPFWTAHNVFEPPDHNFYGPYMDALRERFAGAWPEPWAYSPAARQREAMKGAFRFIAAHPGLTLRRTVSKLADLVHPSLYIYRNFYLAPEESFVRIWLTRIPVLLLLSAPSAAVMLLSAVGLIFCPERRLRLFTLFLVGFHLLVCAFFYGPTRFRMAFMPMLVIFAAWALVHGREIVRQKFSSPVVLLASVWGALMLAWGGAVAELLRKRGGF